MNKVNFIEMESESDFEDLIKDPFSFYIVPRTQPLTGVYGVEWDGGESPLLRRTDDAVNFANPVAAVSDGNGGWIGGSSPFDTIYPWAGMTISERTGGTMVSIPKFYYKITKTGTKMKFQISPNEFSGSHVSPAHMDRGDGNGERDVVYLSRYKCASDWKSKTNVMPNYGYEKNWRATCRQRVHNLGSTLWQQDYAMRVTVWLLYLVEYANWNSEVTIGHGGVPHKSSGDEMVNMGYTDSMTYHTGTDQTNRSTQGGTQYRWIEGLWDNCFEWLDGIYEVHSYSGTPYIFDVYSIINPANFSDTEGGTLVSTVSLNSIGPGGLITAYGLSNVSGFEWFMYPSECNASSADNNDCTKYITDKFIYSENGTLLYGGGAYNDNGFGSGLFYLSMVSRPAYIGQRISTRIMELPNS